jgi:hypothetical protein
VTALNLVQRNIRMRGEEPVLIDYDQTSVVHDSERGSSVNMPRAWRWLAPEVMHLSSAQPQGNEDTISLFTKESDVYSFSMVIITVRLPSFRSYTLLIRRCQVFCEDLPFPRKRDSDVALCVADERNRPDFPPTLRKYGRFTRLTERCWHGNPRLRPDMTLVCQELESGILVNTYCFPLSHRLPCSRSL